MWSQVEKYQIYFASKAAIDPKGCYNHTFTFTNQSCQKLQLLALFIKPKYIKFDNRGQVAPPRKLLKAPNGKGSFTLIKN